MTIFRQLRDPVWRDVYIAYLQLLPDLLGQEIHKSSFRVFYPSFFLSLLNYQAESLLAK